MVAAARLGSRPSAACLGRVKQPQQARLRPARLHALNPQPDSSRSKPAAENLPHTLPNGQSTDPAAPRPTAPQAHPPTALTHPASGTTSASGTLAQAPAHDPDKHEMRLLISTALPISLSNILGYGQSVICSAFVGHLGTQYLSGTVLASSFYNITGLSVILGLSAGMETICGQAYGAGKYQTLGIVLQRAVLVCWAVCVPMLLLWSNSEQLLLSLGQQPLIAATASKYLNTIAPCILLSAVSECVRKYLMAQQVVQPSMVVSLAVTLLAPLYNYLLVVKLGMGFNGAATAYICCQVTTLVLLLGYLAHRHHQLRGTPRMTWPGFNVPAALREWPQYLSFGVPAALMICMEWWAFEVLILMAGNLPDAAVAVSVIGICFTVSSCVYMLPVGLGAATNARVANALGAGNPAAARRTYRTALAAVAGLQACVAAFVLLCGEGIVGVFTRDAVVARLALQLLPMTAVLCFMDGLNAVLNGVLRATGMQKIGALVNLLGYWVLGVPLAAVLGFRLDWGVFGFWVGVGVTSVLQAMVVYYVVSRFDWPWLAWRAGDVVEGKGEGEAGAGPGPAGELPGPALA